MSRFLALALAAGTSLSSCTTARTPLQPPLPPAPSPARPLPTTAPTAEERFAASDPGYAFADPDRKAKLLAAIPKVEAALADEMAREHVPGIAVGLVIDGELVWSKGYGVVDVDTKQAPDADTLYRIGSITKSFTALALMTLRDGGALRLDDPLVMYVPEAAGLVYPTRDSPPITIRQLVTHTAGLPRDVDFEKPDEQSFLAQLAGRPLEDVPGQRWSYSNLGFALAGIAASRAAHASYADVIARRVFDPLGMTASGVDISPKLAPAYEADNKTRHPNILARTAAAGAGGIYSTVRDLARYVAFQLSGYPPRDAPDTGIVKRASIRELHSTGAMAFAAVAPRPDAKRGDPAIALDAASYGFGWEHHITCDADDLVEHSGAIDSFRANVQYLTSRGVGVIALSNFQNASPDRFGKRAIEELRKTGALQPYVAHRRPPGGLDATMQAFLAVYNHFDDAAFAKLLARAPDPQEPGELARYHDLHGDCRSIAFSDMPASNRAIYMATCERGALSFEVNPAADGRLLGFIGTSRELTVPKEITAAIDAVLALTVRWDDAVFTRAFDPKVRAVMQPGFASLREAFGRCKLGEAFHEGFDWAFEATCERGGPRRFDIALANGKLASVRQRPLDPEQRCPVR